MRPEGFFVGMHQPRDAGHLPRAMLSINRLRWRSSAVTCPAWMLDSGAFTEIATHGTYRKSPDDYAAEIRYFATNPGLVCAVSQDFMCEPHILRKTGLTVAEHQILTIERYEALLKAGTAGVYLMPVLQGYDPSEYNRHVKAYGSLLAPGAWVGVGSVCKRNSKPEAILEVLRMIKEVRPDLRLHGFGLKITSLWNLSICKMLHSADSMAWSYNARMNGRDGNSWKEAEAFRLRVESMLEIQ